MIVVRVSLLVEFKEIFEMRNTSVVSSSQQTNNKPRVSIDHNS